jgi:hypothetical protein
VFPPKRDSDPLCHASKRRELSASLLAARLGRDRCRVDEESDGIWYVEYKRPPTPRHVAELLAEVRCWPAVRIGRARVGLGGPSSLRIYLQHYTSERPHRGLALQTPQAPQLKSLSDGDVKRCDRLGGLVHEYYRAAA